MSSHIWREAFFQVWVQCQRMLGQAILNLLNVVTPLLLQGRHSGVADLMLVEAPPGRWLFDALNVITAPTDVGSKSLLTLEYYKDEFLM